MAGHNEIVRQREILIFLLAAALTGCGGGGGRGAGGGATPAPQATVPGPPTIGVVSAGSASATVAFSASSSDGGSPITGYTATCTAAGAAARSSTGAGSPLAVSGLINGTAYSCSVTASNAVGASAPSASAGVTPIAAVATPNILLILADDFGAESSVLYPSLAGTSGQVATPNLQSLAAEGIVFENAWVAPVCSPTRAALLTGRYGNRTGVTDVGDVLPTSITSLFTYVAQSSPQRYRQATFGKWHLGTTAQHVRDTGVTEFRGFLGAAIGNYFNWSVIDQDGVSVPSTTYSTTALTDFAVAFIQNQRTQGGGQPWFLYLPYNAAHGTIGADGGFQVPPAALHSVSLGGAQPGAIVNTLPVYKAMVQAMDTEIGRLLTAIGPPGSAERNNTLVIFMGDNGTPASMKDAGARVRGSKSSVFEGGVRVPLVVAGAGVTRRGVRDASLITATDLYATIARVAGVNVTQTQDSVSFAPLLTGTAASGGRQYSFTEICGPPNSYAIRDARYKLGFFSGTWGLYDLSVDPQETNNLYGAAAAAAERARLEGALETIRQNSTAGCFQ